MHNLEKLENSIASAMIKHVPDGHCDGNEIIAKIIYDEFIKEAVEMVDIAVNGKCAEQWHDNELKMLCWLKLYKD